MSNPLIVAAWNDPDAVAAREQDESYLVQQIRKYLLTGEQERTLMAWRLSIEDLLNGRVPGPACERKYKFFFDDWNDKLGREEFKF